MQYLGCDAALDRVPNQPRRVGPIEFVDRDDPRRRSDIDLRQPLAADHVDPDEQKSPSLELRPQCLANFSLRCGEIAGFRRSPNREVRPYVAARRPAIDRARDFALDQYDPLIALRDLRKKKLEHMRLAIGIVE